MHLFYLSRLMGSSAAEIERTYGHLLRHSEEELRDQLDAFDATMVKRAKDA